MLLRASAARLRNLYLGDIEMGKGNPYHDQKTGKFSIGSGGAGKTKTGDHTTDKAVVGRHGYNPTSVDRAINNASRFQGKVSGAERSAIHRLLKGR